MIDELTVAICLFLANDFAIALFIYGTRRAVRKAARTSNILPDLTAGQEAAVRWWVTGQLESLEKDFHRWESEQVLNG